MFRHNLSNFTRILISAIVAMCVIPNNATATSINGMPIELSGEAGEVTVRKAVGTSNICFKFQGSDIITGTLEGENLNQDATNIYRDIQSRRNLGTRINAGKNIKVKSGRFVEMDGSSLKAGENLLINAKTTTSIMNTIVEIGRDALIETPVIEVNNFFLSTPGRVEFNAHEPKSWLTGVSFKSLNVPVTPFTYLFEGSIDFNTPSNVNKFFIAFGADEVTFKLKKIND